MQNGNRLDIVTLVKTSTISTLGDDYQVKLVQKIKNTFTQTEQQLFVASFISFLNHDTEKDFVIDLDSVWKWLGFSRKDHSKRLLEKCFIIDIDYKVYQSTPLEGGVPRENALGGLGGEGLLKEIILMTVDTFKEFCLTTNTVKSKEIRKYFVKLEKLLLQTILEQASELKLKLKEKNVEMLQLEKKVEILENKPTIEGFVDYKGFVYLIKDTSAMGCYKIGIGGDPKTRLSMLNVSSSQKSLKILKEFETKNMKCAEKMIHLLLEPFKIVKRAEWFNPGKCYAFSSLRSQLKIIE